MPHLQRARVPGDQGDLVHTIAIHVAQRDGAPVSVGYGQPHSFPLAAILRADIAQVVDGLVEGCGADCARDCSARGEEDFVAGRRGVQIACGNDAHGRGQGNDRHALPRHAANALRRGHRASGDHRIVDVERGRTAYSADAGNLRVAVAIHVDQHSVGVAVHRAIPGDFGCAGVHRITHVHAPRCINVDDFVGNVAGRLRVGKARQQCAAKREQDGSRDCVHRIAGIASILSHGN